MVAVFDSALTRRSHGSGMWPLGICELLTPLLFKLHAKHSFKYVSVLLWSYPPSLAPG